MAPFNYDLLLLSLFILLPSVFFLRFSFLLLDLLWRVGGTHRGTLLPTDSLSLSLPLAHIFALSSTRWFYCSKGGGKTRYREKEERERERRKAFSRCSRLLTRSFLNRFREAMHLLRNTACIPRTYLHFIYISINEFHSYDTKEEVENRN